MTDNLYKFKKRIRPEWYEHGQVKTFSKEEVAEWESKDHTRLWAKIDQERGLSKKEIEFLDSINTYQAEETMSDIMQGVKEHMGPE